MAAKPKLDTAQWNEVRARWEGDERKGFPWLIADMDLPVSAEAVRLRAKAEGWKKESSKLGKPDINKLGKQPETKLADNQDDDAETDQEETRSPGRPTQYRPIFAKQAEAFALCGADDARLAELFEVDVATIYRWKSKYPEFRESIKGAKDIADAAVAAALYKSAIGAHFIETDQIVDGKVVTLKRQLPPEIAAQIFWLKNRRPKEWRDKVEVKADVNLNVFPPKEVLDAMYAKALAEAEKMEEKLIGRRERLLGTSIEQEEVD